MAVNRQARRKKLGEILRDEGLITEEQLQTALQEQRTSGGLLGDVLVEMGAISEREMARAIAAQQSYPFISVAGYFLTKEMLSLLPVEVLWKHQFIPLDRFRDVLTIVTAHLLDDELISEIEQRTKCRVSFYVGSASDVRSTLARSFPEETRRALDKVFPESPTTAKEPANPAGKAIPHPASSASPASASGHTAPLSPARPASR